MPLALRFYLLMLFAWMSAGAVAMDAYNLPSTLQRTELFPVLRIALDERGEWSLRDAMRKPFDTPSQIRWGFLQKGQSLWLKTTITNPHPQASTTVLDLGDFAPDDVTYYVVDAQSGELLTQALAGSTYPISNRTIKSHHIAFPLTISANRSIDIYLRIQSRTRIQLAPALYSSEAFQQEEHAYDVGTYLCYGGLIALILYHLIVLLYSREQESAYFIAVMVTWGAYSALLEGLLQSLLPDAWIYNFHSDYQGATAIFPVIALASFTAKYLHQLRTLLYVRWLLFGTCVATAIASVITVAEWLPFQHVRVATIVCILMVAALHTFIFGVLVFNGHKTARFYFAGALLMFLFMVQAARIYTVHSGLYTDVNIWLRLSYIAPLLLFAAGHGQRINELRLQHEASLQQATLMLEQAKFKSSFFAKMSHEIRSPMNGVLGPVQLLRMTPLSQKQANYVDIIEKSGNTLLDVVNDILDYSKLEAGKLTLTVSEFSLRELIGECSAVFSAHPKHLTIPLNTEIATDVIDCVEGDAHRLRQVLFNLIGNAFKFTSQGDIRLTVHKVSETVHGISTLEFSVRDSGIGISAEDLPKLFSEYQQVGVARSKEAGTGLGLAICHQLVGLMGGKISVSSQPGAGSTFSFQIPLRIAATPISANAQC